MVALVNKWIVKNCLVVNLVLIIFCIFVYTVTVYSPAFWTNWRWPDGEKGGALDFRWFSISTVYHVVDETLVAVFSFPDITAYLVIVLIIFNLTVLVLNLGLHIDFDRRRIRNYDFLSLITATLCMLAYTFEMGSIEAGLKEFDFGGVVSYFPLLGVYVASVHHGQVEGGLGGLMWYFPNMLFILFLIFTVIVRSHKSNEQYSVVSNETKPT